MFLDSVIDVNERPKFVTIDLTYMRERSVHAFLGNQEPRLESISLKACGFLIGVKTRFVTPGDSNDWVKESRRGGGHFHINLYGTCRGKSQQ